MSDSKTGKRTLVEEGTAVTGSMASSCPIVVMGKIDGEVSGPSMEIAESGVVSGKIKVTEFSSRGEVAGELQADIVQLAGKVRDETVIRAKSLEVISTPGATLQFGECELSIGDEPDKRRAIEEVTGARKGTPAAAAPPVPEKVEKAAADKADKRRRNTGAVSTVLEGQESGRVA
jgi:cytoskeletal protein CcmA (bactofilin family)